MPTQPSGTQKKSKNAANKSRAVGTLKLEPLANGPPTKKFKPLSALSKTPRFDLGSSQSSGWTASPTPSANAKGKEKATVLDDSIYVFDSDEEVKPKLQTPQVDDRLWVDVYEPQSEAELAVHVRKVKDVRNWLTEAFERGPGDKLRKYRRVLALTGPAGTAKTATIRVLSREMGFEILEWRNTTGDSFSNSDDSDYWNDTDYEGLAEKFHKFLTRAGNCRSVFDTQPSTSSSGTSRKQIILLEDLPNILHPATQQAFHASLEAFVATASTALAPLVLIVSDAGVRGETGDDASAHVAPWKANVKEAVDLRAVIPPSLYGSAFVTNISFNPIAPTLMKRALQNMLNTHFKSIPPSSAAVQPTKELLDLVVESSNGDIRSAIMALQFACTAPTALRAEYGPGKKKKGGKKAKGGDARALMEAVTRREQSLALFHLVGKIMYNKRKGDAPASSTSKADAQKERQLDEKLKDPPPLPSHLSLHDRRASRVDVDTLYADTPIDSSLLSLYIHQNYPQYCDTLEHCDGIIDWLSWVDSSGGDNWLQANPHRFHLITLGTMHSLPSPVQRRGQKAYKPEFFDTLRKQRDAEHAVEDTLRWLRQRDASMSSGWTKQSVAVEIGGLLNALDHSRAPNSPPPPPSMHQTFSRLTFRWNEQSGATVADENDVYGDVQDDGESEAGGEGDQGGDDGGRGDRGGDDGVFGLQTLAEGSNRGGWLEDDDIEEA